VKLTDSSDRRSRKQTVARPRTHGADEESSHAELSGVKEPPARKERGGMTRRLTAAAHFLLDIPPFRLTGNGT
jgi:hypothetical protein